MPRFEFEIKHRLLDELSEGFFWEEQRNALADGLSKETVIVAAIPSSAGDECNVFTVARVRGLSIKIWADEHPPPHFHVTYQGQDASFSILDCCRLRGQRGLERYDPIIRSWWSKNQRLLIEMWNASRPTACPVGQINLASHA
jgi:hypothetical protein